jgi:hypothetical protein
MDRSEWSVIATAHVFKTGSVHHRFYRQLGGCAPVACKLNCTLGDIIRVNAVQLRHGQPVRVLLNPWIRSAFSESGQLGRVDEMCNLLRNLLDLGVLARRR